MVSHTAPAPLKNSSTPALTVEGHALAIYVHWPFCAAKCPYCDFNSHVRHGGVDEERFARALAKELASFAERTPGRHVTSVFFGGGTPSLMAPETVETVLVTIADNWTVDKGAEVTLEANPTSIEASRFRGYRAAGVNRVSIGVQALNDTDLKALGRLHSAEEARAAVSLAADVFERVSFDLIYARMGQSFDAWRRELSEALEMAAGHLSLYQLTIEPGTPFQSLHAAGRLAVPDEEKAATFYEMTQDLTEAAGLCAYEVSNHAVLGQESRHNLTYWRYHDYIGAGPGAHGRFVDASGTRRATAAIEMPEEWASAVERDGCGLAVNEPVNDAEAAAEMLMMGLRLREGADLSRFARLSGHSIPQHTLSLFKAEGLIDLEGGRIAATAHGRLVLNRLLGELLAATEAEPA